MRRILTLMAAAALGWAAGMFYLHLKADQRPAHEVGSTAVAGQSQQPSLDEWAHRQIPLVTIESLDEYRRELEHLKSDTSLGSGRRELLSDLMHDRLSDELIRRTLIEEENHGLRRHDLVRMISNFAKESPREAMEFVERLEQEGKVSSLLALRSAVNRQWIQQSAAEALACATVRAEKDSYAIHYLVEDWTWIDAEGALRALATLPQIGNYDPSNPDYAPLTPFRKWLSENPDAAAAWVESDCPTAWREPMRRAVVESGGLAPWEKITALKQIPDPFSNSIENVWSAWLGSDPTAAVAKLNELEAAVNTGQASGSDQEIVAAARRAQFVGAYEEQPIGRLRGVVDGINSESTRDILILRFMNSRMQFDFDTCAAATLELRTGIGRQRGFDALIKHWANRDLESLSGFINNLPEDPSRHTAVVSLVRELAPIEPEAAIAWAESLPAGSAARQRADSLVNENAR